MLRDLEGGEGRGERLSAPRSSLNRPTLKMHLDSMLLRCVREHASGKTRYTMVPGVTSGGDGVESWDIQHSP